MKKPVFGILLLMILMVFFFQTATSAENEEKSPKPSASVSPKVSLPPFSPVKHKLVVGEKHVYEISYRNIGAGTGSIEVKDKVGKIDPYYKVEMKAKSSKLVAFLYPVLDTFVSHVNMKQGYTQRFERHMREGRNAKHFRDEVIEYDYDNLKFNYTSCKKQNTEPKKFSKDGTKNVLDPLAAVMYLREMELAVNKSYALPIHSSSEDWVLKLKCTGLVGLRVPGIGKFNAYKLVPDTKEDALFTSKGVMTIWFEKNTKVILRAEVDIPIGKIVIRLITAENSPLEKVNRSEKRRRWIRPGTKDIP